jgi:hypothetical protein
MHTTMKKRLMIAVLAVVALASLSCSHELAQNAAPVELVLSTTQELHQIDLQFGATGCSVGLGTITMQVFPKNANSSGTLLSAVRVNRYRVSYRRIDGGTLVPRSFVRSMDALINQGDSVGLSDFIIFEADALSQAPFAALQPQNGSRDPETGRPTVKLEVIIEVFGETLGGDNVSDSTAFVLDFCFECGGCL